MSTLITVPRYRLGEISYQLLWYGVVGLPLLAGILRSVTMPGNIVLALYALIGIPATVAAQVMAALLASNYRKQQWRHWLGPVASWSSFVYYGLWLLLVITIPDANANDPIESPFARAFGLPAAESATAVLLFLLAAAYLTLLVSIAIEGKQAVERWSVAEPDPDLG